MVTEVHAQCFALHVPTVSICSIFHPVLGTHTSTTNEEHQTNTKSLLATITYQHGHEFTMQFRS